MTMLQNGVEEFEMMKKRWFTYAASTPKVCIAPFFVAHGTWKYATLKPPSVRAKLIKAEISPY